MTEWTTKTLKEHIEALRLQDKQALAIQATEYERRLHLLNDEHGRAAQALATYLPRELWDKYEDETRSWRLRVETRLAAEDGKRAGSNAVIGLIVSGVSLIVTIAVGVVSYLHN